MEDVRKPVAFAALGFLALIAGVVAGSSAHAADYAPLNCTVARSPTERAICANYALGQLEARMATLYEWTTSLVAMGERGDIGDAQRAFIKTREACGANIACIRSAYDARISQLESVMQGVASHGPF
jgi:uncharacterized protein